jgi:ADP-ribosylglycohydrolase
MKDKVRGAIVGTAIGDALGMPAEGKSPDTIRKIYGYISSYRNPRSTNGKPFHHNLDAGMWTDDTQLMVAIGRSLTRKKRIDYNDIASEHIFAFHNRRGWGKATINSVQRMISGAHWSEAAEPNAAGNGVAMKIAPIGVLLGLEKINNFDMVTVVTNIARMTHGDTRATIAAIVQCYVIASALKHGCSGLRLELCNLHYKTRNLERSFGYRGVALSTILEHALVMADTNESDSEIRAAVGAGPFVLESFPFTCALVYKYCDNIEKCMENIINQGGDADTTGAMAGSMLGAAYGYSKFPFKWRKGLEDRRKLLAMADGILKMSQQENQ